METAMFIHEYNEIKSQTFNKDSIFVMDCTFEKLTEICKDFLQKIDDYTQMAGEKENESLVGYFVQSYHELEAVYFHLKEGCLVTSKCRNEIRMLIKESEKMACVNFLELQ